SAHAYALDRPTGTVLLLSHKYDSQTTAVGGGGLALSADGTKAVFGSAAPNVVAGFVDNNGGSTDGYYCDLTTGVNTLVTHAAGSPTAGANKSAGALGLSADGSAVLISSTATNLVPGFVAGNANAMLVYAYSVAT